MGKLAAYEKQNVGLAERHLARDLRQRLHQEVHRAHPHLERCRRLFTSAVRRGLRLPRCPTATEPQRPISHR